MTVTLQQLGSLTCRVVEEPLAGAEPSILAILCHGFGAPGTDLVSIGPDLFHMAPDLCGKVRFVFPEAPLSLDSIGYYGARAWWMLDVERLVAAVERGDTRILREHLPAGLESARNALIAAIEAVQAEYHVPTNRTLLGGFSQGAMLATDVALRLPEPPGALAIFSGTLLCEQEWRPLMAERGPFPVLLSHGRQDQILPYAGAEWLRDALLEAGHPVDWRPFQGGHGIPPTALDGLIEQLRKLAARAS